MLLITSTIALLLPLATAHTGCGGHELGARNPGGRLIRTYEEGRRVLYGERYSPLLGRQVADSNEDVNAECQAYTYAPINAVMANYPASWDTADLIQGDAEAANLFAQINKTVNERLPYIAPNGDGTHAGQWGTGFVSPTDTCWWTNTQCVTPNASTGLEPDFSIVPEPQTWGLSFDDGPNCSHNAFYNFLQEQEQLATLFYIGSNVFDWPVEAQRGFKDGHEICVHTWSHQYMTSFSNQQAFAELYYTQKLIKDIIGVTPRCFRPPYGDVDDRIRLIASLLNMTTNIWSEDTNDGEIGSTGTTIQTVEGLYANILAKAKNGSYATFGPGVLTHEIDNNTMSVFIEQYPAIKAAFKHIVPIATALNITNPYMESNVTFPDFDSYVTGDRTGSPASTSTASATPTSVNPVAAPEASAQAPSSSISHAVVQNDNKHNEAGRAVRAPVALLLGGVAVAAVL